MTQDALMSLSERPQRLPETPVPSIPAIDETKPDVASVQYSRFRTKLSTHRTGLSEHRTSLSEYRTDLSTGRTEMSMRRTGMSFQRTRMSADRTLMSVIRTSLSLISFGFTIYQVFEKLREAGSITHAGAPRNFGIALVLLGIAMLGGGIIYHVQFMTGLRQERANMKGGGLIHGESGFPISITLITAGILLLIGILAVLSMVFDIGPFG
ncbi:DUF202 domain-containing protein [Hyphomicrobium sp.]|jgi:uncharacterized membrane protein YidH (DUF202 family)|uniref:YidH family protein n=1 Tax=Hyphomicrobium sp. TaxID=82 RepID=UPI0025BE3C1F|nr:DUF202 domain-containing protein [Hyphomicrobium sp.]